ncbi:MAG: PQQ-binding-like beta-propeller repeat protein, partial [Spirochaetota bacterium]|nr:PQQ-binding-like beta-propeller repeat protein [Spirochaetota bacterium]
AETSKEYTITLEKTKAEPETKEEKTPVKEEEKETPQTLKEEEEPVVSIEEKVAETKENPVKKDAVLENVSIDKNTAETVPEVEKLIDVSIRIEPTDAHLVVNGERVRSNIFSGKFPEGTSINIEGSRNGFRDKSKLLTVGERSSNVTISLDPRPLESTLAVSKSKLVGSISTGSNMIYTSDSNGLISAVTPEGRLVWSFASANKSVENSYPVFSNNRIYFSGSSELVVINALNGKVIERKALDKNSAHIFGRRLVPFGSQSLFPSNDEIRVLNGSSGNLVRTISLPGSGSRMTPAVWKNKILSVDQNGTFSIINPDSGVVEKEITTTGSQPIALSITIKNNLAVFSGRKGNAVCIDLDAEKVLWDTQLISGGSKVQVYSDIVCSNSGVYIYTKGTIHALNLTTGEKLFENISDVSSPPGVIANQLVFGDNNNNLVFMNSKNGRIDKILDLNDTVSARPAALGGLIAAGTLSGKLLVINPEGIQ